MMTRSVLLLALLATSAKANPSIRRRVEELDAEGGRIVGGTTPPAGQYPWFVLLGNGTCGGTLIAGDRVLTSATCIINQNPKTVRIGARNATDGITVGVRCSNVHPDYFRTSDSIFNDVAVIKLTQKVTGVSLVKLNTNISYPTPRGQSLTTMGFGFTSSSGPSSSTLQATQLNFLSTFQCQQTYPSMTIYSTQHLCALTPGQGVCNGDSGGPLMDAATTNSTQIGITSFKFGSCGSATFPDVFANVASYSGWITAEISSTFCQGETASQSPSIAPPTTPRPTPTPAPSKAACVLDTISNAVEPILKFIDRIVTGDNNH